MKIIMDPRRIVAVSLLALLTSSCGSKPFTPETPVPANPFLIDGRDAEFAETCASVYLAELGREPDAAGAADCVDRCRRGETTEQLLAWVRASDEYKARQARLAQEAQEADERRKREEDERASRQRFRGRLSIAGTQFVGSDGAVFRPVFASGMALLTRPAAERAAFLDWLQEVGFNGLRLFVGDLNWHDLTQRAADARAVLPTVLEEARARNLYVLVSAVTDSRAGGYDIEAHLRAVADIARAHDNAVLEAFNEPYHGTQADIVNDTAAACAMARRVLADYPYPWALGAAADDRPIGGRYETDCGTFNTAHLRRGNPDEMLAAMHGLAEVQRVTQKPLLNSEPMGAAEEDRPGSRLADPAFFGRMAHRGISLGFGNLFHSSDGLYGRVPGPVQQAAARAFVDGSWQEPVAVPPPPPEVDPCADAADAASVVACTRSRYSSGHLTPDQLADLMQAIVRTLNAKNIPGGPYGVLVKRSGNNCRGYSCDIVCAGNGPDQRQFDVLVDERIPTWSPLGAGIRVDVCEIVR